MLSKYDVKYIVSHLKALIYLLENEKVDEAIEILQGIINDLTN